ncbi:hypothetical protein M9Y10_032087 [Tritrichomonas musculus]|uniref:RRM domain-containing protein n=1 Tax=Tritrichomonas musculus TaxID=1915356 RepID=A0ABR2GZ23_9EUKA
MSRPEIKTVYVGDIVNSADEDFLKSAFGPPNFGQILSLTLQQSKKPVENAKYAFITYESQEEAQKVVDEMNYSTLDGYEIRVSIADPNFQKIRSNEGNITLRNLDDTIDTKMIHDAFSQFGEVVSCRIPKGKNGEKFGVAYIQFKNPKDAQQAIKEMTGMVINGRNVTIEKFNPLDNSQNIHIKKGIPTEVESTPELKTFLINLYSKNADEKDDDEEGGPFSNLEHATLLKLPDNPQYRQAYLTFTDKESTKLAQSILEKAGINCERVTNTDKINHMKQNSAHWNQYKARDTELRCLYVKNIPIQYTEKQLQDFFSQFSDVVKCSLKPSNDTSSYAYVTFRTPEGAKYALKKSTLACSHFLRNQRKNLAYPTQLYVAAYSTRETKLKISNEERARAINNKKKLNDKILINFGENSMQYDRFKQLSPEQITALIEDNDLYDDWADDGNNLPYDDDFDGDDDDEEEEDNDDISTKNSYSSNRGNWRGKRGRGRGNFRPHRGQRGGRGGRGRGKFVYTPRNSNTYDDNYDDDDFD